MRVGHLQPTRPEWYDRNPVVSLVSFVAQIVGAQAGTIQASFTVPSTQKAYLDLAMMSGFRQASGVPPVYCAVILRITVGAVTANILRMDSDVSFAGAVGDQFLGQGGILLPGNAIEWFTQTTGTSGTVLVVGTAKVTAYDA